MQSDLQIRRAEPAERAALEALQLRASLVWEEYREALLAHKDAVTLPNEQIAAGGVYVGERDGAVLGFVAVLPRADGQADLDGLFVEPGVWKSGVGRRLLVQAEHLAAAIGAVWLYVVANPRALGFYAACGFDVLGEEPTRFGPAITMRKALSVETAG